jgi:hypothetical protein
MKRLQHIAALALACLACGCLDNDLPPAQDTESGAEYIALQRDFADFRDWKSFEIDEVETDGVHGTASANVVVYVNALPKRGAKAFPKGTLIVKAVQVADERDWTLHAMAKRGGTFNQEGALGWEFFELSINSNLDTVMVWRGEHPPNGETYQMLPGAKPQSTTTESDCSGCHATATNDAVLDDALQLEDLP